MSSPRARVDPASIRSTRSRVGGTTGSPSVTPLSNQVSNSSSAFIARLGDANPDLRFRQFPRTLGQTPGTRQLEGPGLGEDSGNWQVMTLAVTKGAILGMN